MPTIAKPYGDVMRRVIPTMLVAAILLFVGVVYVVVNLVVDLCYPFFDPRVAAE